MRQLTGTQLKQLDAHKYSCITTSYLEPYMQVFWNWLVEQCPLYLAPNLITIIGLAINIITSLTIVYYSPDAKQEVPRWVCFLCCFGLFAFQSLDAVDGKQARRTGTSSPLGELFDHGCDSISTTFVSLGVACAVQLGIYPYWLFVQCLMSLILFYCSHWQTYVSGTLRFGNFDVTEAQFVVFGVLLISTIFGSQFWLFKVPLLGITGMCLPTVFAGIAGIIALIGYFKVIFIKGGVGRNGSTVAISGLNVTVLVAYITIGLSQFCIIIITYIPRILWGGAGKNGSTIAGTSVLSPIVPLFLFVAPAVLVAWKSPSNIYEKNPVLYLFTFGFLAARVTNRLIVAHMTKSEMNYVDSSMFGPAALFLNQYFNCPINERYLLGIVFNNCGTKYV